jgi:hypothetical protein
MRKYLCASIGEGQISGSRYKKERYELLEKPDVSIVMRLGRIRWTDHMMRMEGNEMLKRIPIT